MLWGSKELFRTYWQTSWEKTSKEIENNCLQHKTSIECARWLAFQACAFRGHDDGFDSKKWGNFIELKKHTSTFNESVARAVLENAL